MTPGNNADDGAGAGGVTRGPPETLKGLVQGDRPDPRFFNFPDGSAEVLLEKSGTFYRLSESK